MEPKALGNNGGDRKSEQYQGNNCNPDIERGNSADYLTARIARDHPEILDGMKEGKYNAHAPAITVGAFALGLPRDNPLL